MINTNIFERITKIAETKGFRSINDFALNGLGYKSSEKINRLKDPTKKPSFEIVHDISNKFEDISVRWLVTGEEESPRIQSVREPAENYNLKTDRKVDLQTIPLYDVQAIAGITPIFTDLNKLKPLDFLHIPNAPKSDGAIYARGDSMYSIIKSGDILCYKTINDIENDIFWGQIYILDLTLSTDDLLTTKYIKKGKDAQHILLVSANQHHQDKEIHISKIRGLAHVKTIVRFP